MREVRVLEWGVVCGGVLLESFGRHSGSFVCFCMGYSLWRLDAWCMQEVKLWIRM